MHDTHGCNAATESVSNLGIKIESSEPRSEKFVCHDCRTVCGEAERWRGGLDQCAHCKEHQDWMGGRRP